MEDETILKLYDMFMDDIYTITSNNYEKTSEITKLEDQLNKTLNDKQTSLLEEIQEKESKRVEEVFKNVFVYSYKLATKLLIEGLSGNNKKIESKD